MTTASFEFYRYAFLIVLTATTVNAQSIKSSTQYAEFRIDTSVYVNDNKTPSSQNITLFSNGVVYDFSMSKNNGEPSEITIFDSKKKSFTLLDVQRKIKFQIGQSQLVSLSEGLRAATRQNPETRFLVTDDYQEEHDEATGWFSLANDVMTYRFQGRKPRNTQVLDSYNDFLRQYTLLGATNPSQLPPFPRLRFNRIIRKSGLIPTVVERSVKESGFFRHAFTMSSKHALVETITDSDRRRIELANSYGVRFRAADMASYRGLSPSEASSDSSAEQK